MVAPGQFGWARTWPHHALRQYPASRAGGAAGAKRDRDRNREDAVLSRRLVSDAFFRRGAIGVGVVQDLAAAQHLRQYRTWHGKSVAAQEALMALHNTYVSTAHGTTKPEDDDSKRVRE
eukprot:1487615-Rhodomonas_salina.1